MEAPTTGDPEKRNMTSDSDDGNDTVKSAASNNGSPSKVTTRPKRCKKISVAASGTPSARKYNLKVPAFSPDDPEIWFALLEGQFENFGITEDNIKFNNVISNLDIAHAKAVKDLIVNPPA